MSAPGSRALYVLAGVAGLAVWAATALIAASPALQGWLIGFVFVSGLSLGALAVVLIQRLVGGRWGAAFAPELEPAARATPLLLLLVLPVLIGAPLIYPWAAAPASLDPQVHWLYLNLPLFVVRTLAALGGLSLVAVMLPRIEGPRGRLGAGLALAFYGLAVSVVGVDWVLSVKPGWTSSNFGMDLATQELAAAFAFAALQGRRQAADAASGDLAGLLLATLVGLTYLEFMSYLVVWYGDTPNLDAWYIPRVAWPWRAAPLTSLVLGLVAVALLAGRRAFGAHRAVAWAGGLVLAALLSYQVWLLAPAFGGACLIPAVFALIGQLGLWLAAAGGLPRLQQPREALAHAA